MIKLAFLGYGKFAKAFVGGLQLSTPTPYQIVVSAPSLRPGDKVDGARSESDNRAAIQGADLVILSVKPAQVKTVMEEVGPWLAPTTLLTSVVTGITVDYLASFCPTNLAIIRAMPNTPIAIQRGAIGLYAPPSVSENIKQSITALYQCLGICHWVENELDLDRLTALSGSGPAYVFLFLEALVQAGVKLGLPETLAKTFAIETVIGSSLLAQHAPASLQALREQVTSPGGTTQAALKQLTEGHFAPLVEKAVKAAFDRARELGQNKDLPIL